MKVVLGSQMQAIDRIAIQEVGIPGIVLMENAGRAVVDILWRRFEHLLRHRVGIVVGKGNNGGDGMVIARHLINDGVEVDLFLLGKPEEFKGDAAVNFNILDNMGVAPVSFANRQDFLANREELECSEIIIDSIFGTGLTKPVRGLYKDVIDYINELDRFVAAVDLPSGMCADRGRIGVNIRADLTVTFALPKLGSLIYPSAEDVGRLYIAPISIPDNALASLDIQINLLMPEYVSCPSLRRDASSHKGDFGHLLVIAGSRGLSGAAVMAARSAMRIGAGLVTLAVPESMNPIFEQQLIEVMTRPLPETEAGSLSVHAAETVLSSLDRYDAALIGPGLSTDEETQALVRELIPRMNLPLILDADGINALAESPEILHERAQTIDTAMNPMLITPHPGEMARLMKKTVAEVQSNRIEATREITNEFGVYTVLKGARSIIAHPNGQIFINSTGNPGMASGGTGDVLAGILGGLIVQGHAPGEAANFGVYLHGLAGDIVAKNIGQHCLMACDLIEVLPEALMTACEEQSEESEESE